MIQKTRRRRRTHPEEEVQGVLDGAKRQSFLPARQIDGQVVELLPFGHRLATAATTTANMAAFKPKQSTLKQSEKEEEEVEASPFAGDGVLHLELHVDGHGAGVDAGGVGLVAGLPFSRLGSVVGRRTGASGVVHHQAPVHPLHVVLQLIQTLTQELVSVLVDREQVGDVTDRYSGSRTGWQRVYTIWLSAPTSTHFFNS